MSDILLMGLMWLLANNKGGAKPPVIVWPPMPGKQPEPPAGQARLTIVPSALQLRAGESSRVAAVVVAADGTTQDVSADASWSASSGGPISVAAGGNATALGVGTGSLSASYNGLSASVPTTVTAAAAAPPGGQPPGQQPPTPVAGRWASIAKGEGPYAFAARVSGQKYAGNWKHILDFNPGVKLNAKKDGVLNNAAWQPGVSIRVPDDWPGGSAQVSGRESV